MALQIPEAPQFNRVKDAWNQTLGNKYLLPEKRYYVPGGELLNYIDEGNPIGDAFKSTADRGNGIVNIAGVPLSYEGLVQLREVYYPENRLPTLCVDPRLDGGSIGDHVDCGMCKATSGAITLKDVDQILLEQLGGGALDLIHDQLRDGHRSITALYSLGDSVTPSKQMRFNYLMENGALPFRGTIPVMRIERAQQENGPDLLNEATKLIAGITNAVMKGNHNKYAEEAKKGPLVIIDTQGLSQSHPVVDQIHEIMKPRETLFVNTKQ
jgi:hypothetical protein